MSCIHSCTLVILCLGIAGKQVIVCAPRYVKFESDNRWGQGKCFTLTQTLKNPTTWDPCEGRAKNLAHEQWGFCQAGMSAAVDEDSTALIGSPGPFTWRGTVFAVSVEEDFLLRDKTHYHTPVRPGESPVEKYAYLGMSVTSGNFLPQHQSCGQKSSYASGAPRSGGTGKVVIFVKCLSERMKIQKVLKGDKFASSFGYSLAAADVNGDSFSDLIVGAPFYYDFETNRDGGAVYVFMNSADGIAETPSAKLFGSVAEARFGYSVINAGDLNNDGFDDLVVGAPYDGRGKIFVFMGGEDGLSDEGEPDQVISAEQIRGRFPSETFGFSLSGGMDVDLNNHSDIVVGAFESDVAVIIRSRPVIDIVTWFGNTAKRVNPKLYGCENDPLAQEVCFEIESCFLIKNFPSNIERTYIRYSLNAEVFPGGRKVSRVRFGDEFSNATHQSEKVIPIRRDSLTGCFLETAYLKRETTDLTTPIALQLTLKLEQDSPKHFGGDTISNINQYPILNQQEAKKELILPFQKFCGDDDTCSSDLYAKIHIEGLDEISNRLEVKDKSEVLLMVSVSNDGEPAYAAKMFMDIDPAFTYVGQDDNSRIACEFLRQGRIECQLGNPFNANATEELFFRLLPNSNRGFDQRNAVFNVSTSTTSEDVKGSESHHSVPIEIVRRAEISIKSSVQPEQIWYGGKLRGESAMKVMSDIGSKVTHTFHVANDGPWHLDEFEVLIDWPYQVSVPDRPEDSPGKWLLYLASDPELSPRGIGTCFVNPRAINSLGLREVRRRNNNNRHFNNRKSVPRRRKRDAAASYEDSLHCSDARLKCQALMCRLKGLRSGETAVIRLRSRVWNSTLVEDFSRISTGLGIKVSARLLLPPQLEADQDIRDDSTEATLIAVPNLPPSSTFDSVPTWLILVAVAVGLILVCLIIAVLYKFGFFKRQRHKGAEGGAQDGEDEDMISGKKVTMPRTTHKGGEYIS